VGDERERDDGLAVLRDIWSGRGQTGAALGHGGAKVCKNMKNIGFGGIGGTVADGESTAGPVDADQRAAWRARLAREGKIVPGSITVREMILDDDTPRG
jgi:hypothetical protein